MDLTVITYVIYLVISIGLTIWVARTLSRNGRVFLADVLHGNEKLADAVNHLLVVGFYLVNLGFVALYLKCGRHGRATPAGSSRRCRSSSASVLLVLGVMHLGNVYVLNRIRRRGLMERRAAPAGDRRRARTETAAPARWARDPKPAGAAERPPSGRGPAPRPGDAPGPPADRPVRPGLPALRLRRAAGWPGSASSSRCELRPGRLASEAAPALPGPRPRRRHPAARSPSSATPGRSTTATPPGWSCLWALADYRADVAPAEHPGRGAGWPGPRCWPPPSTAAPTGTRHRPARPPTRDSRPAEAHGPGGGRAVAYRLGHAQGGTAGLDARRPAATARTVPYRTG